MNAVAEGADNAVQGISLLPGNEPDVGRHEIQKGVFLDMLEKSSTKIHRHFRGSLPESNGVEESFIAGPIFAIYAEDAVVDLNAGLTLIDGKPVRETAVVSKLTEHYKIPSPALLAATEITDPSHIVLPLASQRMRNYCRWWLDSVAKHYICSVSPLARAQMRGRSLDVMLPEPELLFQRQTARLPNWRKVLSTRESGLRRGRSVNSPGLAFGGGQRIGAMTAGFSQYLDLAIPQANLESGERPGELLYISRNESGMRRIINEEELLPGLRDIGFTIVTPSEITLRDQIEHFRAARVVLSAHGAGLTNILFCRPGATLIEIFPDGGVHGSAFLRIASHLDFNYYFVVGSKIETPQGRKNPNNSDLKVDKDSFLAFVRQAVDASR